MGFKLPKWTICLLVTSEVCFQVIEGVYRFKRNLGTALLGKFCRFEGRNGSKMKKKSQIDEIDKISREIRS